MFGSHLSIAGGMHNALIAAHELKFDCVQVFTKNQRQWKTKPLEDDEVKTWNEHRKKLKIGPVVSHDSYLINLGSPGEVRDKSIALFHEELTRCETLDIPFLVAHPGAHVGEGEEAGLKRIAESLDQIHKDLPGLKTITCLEVTAGQGTNLGYRLEHLRDIRNMLTQPERVAFCLDSAHLIAGGYDLTSAAGAKGVLDEIDAVLGFDLIKVWHLNDSKVPLGSRVDRHAHIGHGHVSLDAFAEIVRHKAFRKTPKILETPKEDTPEGVPWDTINCKALQDLM